MPRLVQIRFLGRSAPRLRVEGLLMTLGGWMVSE
jgi:hypothetical protein